MSHRSRWLGLRSRWLDRLAALVLAPVVAPVVAALAWWVRRGDGPPSFVALERVGADGRRFRMWKLRSMRVVQAGGTAGGAAITAGDDDRITPVGAVLRRWRLDELPQLWNVLRGDMALIGPRPETPSMVDLDDPRWRAVLAGRPGIAGPTQLVVERWEADVLDAGDQDERYRAEILPVKLALDAWYVARATPLLDLQVAWSMVQRFALGRGETTVDRVARARVAAATTVPLPGAVRG